MIVLNAHFCCEIKFVAIWRSKLGFLLRNTGVDSDFSSEFLRKDLAGWGSAPQEVRVELKTCSAILGFWSE